MKVGIDNIRRASKLLKGKKVGLVANPASVDSNGVHTSVLLRKWCKIVMYFSLEHGFNGKAAAGAAVEDEMIDDIPVYSLYDGKGSVLPRNIDSLIDVLVYDVQDLSLRFYTYISSLKAIVEASQKHNFTLIILDRPSPFGRRVMGSPLTNPYFSFVGCDALPIVYSLTPAELSLFFLRDYSGKSPVIIPLSNWQSKSYEKLNRPFIPTSPNIKNYETAFVYAGTCFLEGTNISEGRGTNEPFLTIGAPFIDSHLLIESLKDFKDLEFTPTSFTPKESKWKGELCHGIKIKVNSYRARPVDFGLILLNRIFTLFPEAKFLAPSEGSNIAFIDRLLGEGGKEGVLADCEGLIKKWKIDASAFKAYIKQYYIYR